jgi:hypothetical protein
MNGAYAELVLAPLRQMRRSLVGWAIALGSLVAVTVAFWPAFRGSSGISQAIDQLPSGVVEAFWPSPPWPPRTAAQPRRRMQGAWRRT